MEWSPPTRSVWGKTDQASGHWLPLVRHLEDAAATASILWHEFVPASTKRLIADAIDGSLDEAGVLVSWLAGVHDVGKASPEFAWKARLQFNYLLDRMRDQGLDAFDTHTSFGHWTVSQIALTDWLVAKTGSTPLIAGSLACIVGGHHGHNPSRADLEAARNTPAAIGTGPWEAVRRELLDGMAHLTGADAYVGRWASKLLPLPAQAALAGLVVMADWIASDSDLFGYLDATAAVARARRATTVLQFPPPWTPTPPVLDASGLLGVRFPGIGATASRPIQDAAVQAARACTETPLLIIEAPMGVGKTEAALLAAEILAARFGQGGVFVGLPTMATANPMFDRTLDWLTTSLGAEDASISLAHSKAGLNDRYVEVLRESRRGEIYDAEGAREGRAVAHGWLRGRRRAGLASFVVGTIDQGLFGALKAKHLALRHLGLIGKVVILDEVHSADHYMRQYLKGLLSWLGAYRTPVILMSATLPPDQRDEFLAAYALGRGVRRLPPTDRTDAYPRLTAYDAGVQTIEVAEASDSTEVTLRRIADDPAVTVDVLAELLSEGGCAGVICNTVTRAQTLFRALAERFPGEVELHHSRFLAPERAVRAASLVRRLGRSGDERPQRLIVVGTQVLEQSLDVDFDVLVTDLAPIDLVLQRAGRLHRHGRPRPHRLGAPQMYLRGVDDWSAAPPQAVRGARTIYGQAPLLRSAAVLAGRERLVLPDDIPTLVRQGYDPDLAPPLGWEEAWASALVEDAAHRNDQAGRAQAYLLDPPNKWTTLAGWIDVTAGDPDNAAEQGRSAVRDSEDGLEVIVVYRDGDALRLPDSAPRHGGAIVPTGAMWGTSGEDASLARAMAACTLGLPLELTNPGTIERTILALEQGLDCTVWQESPWLKGQLVLVLDADGRAVLDLGRESQARNVRAVMQYSLAEGLTVTKELA